MKKVTSLSETLWEANADLAEDALRHRFVRGLADGSLPLESFRGYVAQDAFFLESFARAYALALARSDDQRGVRDFAGLISSVAEELELHEGYARRWGVSLRGVKPVGATLTYTDFLLSTAALKGVDETCAAMTPCMRLYSFLGRSLAEEGYEEDSPYAEWIRTYSDPGFEALTAKLEALLDRYADDAPNVRSVYRRAMALELAFFEAGAS